MVFPQWLNAIGVRPGGTAPMVVRPGGTAPVRSPPVPVVRSSLTTSTSPASPPVDLVRGTTIAAHIFQGTQLPWRVMEQQQSSVQSILAAQASTPAQTSICPPTRREKMGALQRAMLPPPATGRPGARGATVATTGAATDEQPAKAPSAKLGRKERQYSEEQVRAAARRLVASARRGKSMRAAEAARLEGAPSMRSVLSGLMTRVWAVREGPTCLVDKWLARDDLIAAWCAPRADQPSPPRAAAADASPAPVLALPGCAAASREPCHR